MTYDELAEAKTIVEIDDVYHARVVISQTMHMDPELRMMRVAEMLATLREYYVQIGKSTASGPKGARELLEWMDRKGGLGYDVHDRIRKVLGKPKQFD